MKKTFWYILVSTFMFSSMEIALKSVGNLYNPIQLNFIRFLVGGLILLPLALHNLHRAHQSISKLDWIIFATTGFLCVIVSMTLYQLAIMYDKPATVAVLFSCNPVFALLFAFILLHEKLSRAEVLSLVITIIGLIIIVNPTNLTNPVGMFLGVLSALTFGLYSVVSRLGNIIDGLDGITMTAFTFIAGSIELFVMILLTNVKGIALRMENVSWLKPFVRIPITKNVNLSNFWILFFISVCVTGGGFAFYFLAMETGGLTKASLVFFIKPALAPVLASILIHEKITLTMTIGIIVIILGSLIGVIINKVSDMHLNVLFHHHHISHS